MNFSDFLHFGYFHGDETRSFTAEEIESILVLNATRLLTLV